MFQSLFSVDHCDDIAQRGDDVALATSLTQPNGNGGCRDFLYVHWNLISPGKTT